MTPCLASWQHMHRLLVGQLGSASATERLASVARALRPRPPLPPRPAPKAGVAPHPCTLAEARSPKKQPMSPQFVCIPHTGGLSAAHAGFSTEPGTAVGVNIYKAGSDPPLPADGDCPPWLWDLAEPPLTLSLLQRKAVTELDVPLVRCTATVTICADIHTCRREWSEMSFTCDGSLRRKRPDLVWKDARPSRAATRQRRRKPDGVVGVYVSSEVTIQIQPSH